VRATPLRGGKEFSIAREFFWEELPEDYHAERQPKEITEKQMERSAPGVPRARRILRALGGGVRPASRPP